MLMDMLDQLPEESRLPLVSEMFSTFVSIKFMLSDFLCLATSHDPIIKGWTDKYPC